MNTLLTENLYKALKQVKRTSFHSLPVLNYILLEFSNGELRLVTTDLEKPLIAKCACRMNDEWSTCVPMVTITKDEEWDSVNKRWKKHTYKYYPFIDYVKVAYECGYDVLELDLVPETQTLVVKARETRSVAEFKCLDAQEFPPVEVPDIDVTD